MKIITQTLKEFDKFKNSSDRNRHIGSALRLYVRRSHRLVNGKMYPFLDLASINLDEKLQGKGIFTSFLKNLLEIYPSDNFYIESIMNPRVITVAEKFGFQKTKIFDNITCDMYILRNED